ncbi:MAG TPA: 50S ribosomal protein L13 [candidate division Zixibacteria bacterium]|nr:50S ribosomal protein L13 [candidate division Zixibacteria bacterium]HEQ99661.1 50S ribosomal protein L13 [candidate division Zixibacteria bacterium]
MKTYIPKLSDLNKKWYVVDLDGKVLGRQAGQIARILMGKNKPQFTPHLDAGDYVIVVNAQKVVITGKKMFQKRYFRYTGYPGGLRSKTFEQMISSKPEDIIRSAVKGMLPKNRLGRKMMKKLFVYRGPEHPHQAQKPEPLEL